MQIAALVCKMVSTICIWGIMGYFTKFEVPLSIFGPLLATGIIWGSEFGTLPQKNNK